MNYRNQFIVNFVHQRITYIPGLCNKCNSVTMEITIIQQNFEHISV